MLYNLLHVIGAITGTFSLATSSAYAFSSGGHEMLSDGDVRPHHGAVTPEAGRCAAFGDTQRQELSRANFGDAGKVVGPEVGYPAPPALRYNNGLPPPVAPKPGAAPKFSTPNLSGDTIIIGESSLVWGTHLRIFFFMYEIIIGKLLLVLGNQEPISMLYASPKMYTGKGVNKISNN